MGFIPTPEPDIGKVCNGERCKKQDGNWPCAQSKSDESKNQNHTRKIENVLQVIVFQRRFLISYRGR